MTTQEAMKKGYDITQTVMPLTTFFGAIIFVIGFLGWGVPALGDWQRGLLKDIDKVRSEVRSVSHRLDKFIVEARSERKHILEALKDLKTSSSDKYYGTQANKDWKIQSKINQRFDERLDKLEANCEKIRDTVYRARSK
jgi:hypothetical protein